MGAGVYLLHLGKLGGRDLEAELQKQYQAMTSCFDPIMIPFLELGSPSQRLHNFQQHYHLVTMCGDQMCKHKNLWGTFHINHMAGIFHDAGSRSEGVLVLFEAIWT